MPSCPAHAQRWAPLLAPQAGWVPHLDGPLRWATLRTGLASWALCLLLRCVGQGLHGSQKDRVALSLAPGRWWEGTDPRAC